jgi:hypothetical protein
MRPVRAIAALFEARRLSRGWIQLEIGVVLLCSIGLVILDPWSVIHETNRGVWPFLLFAARVIAPPGLAISAILLWRGKTFCRRIAVLFAEYYLVTLIIFYFFGSDVLEQKLAMQSSGSVLLFPALGALILSTLALLLLAAQGLRCARAGALNGMDASRTERLRRWFLAIIAVGVALPLLCGLATTAYPRLSGSFETMRAPDIGTGLQISLLFLQVGVVSFSWWPFVFYAFIMRRIYRVFAARGLLLSPVVMLAGLVAIALPAGYFWCGAFDPDVLNEWDFLLEGAAMVTFLWSLKYQLPAAVLAVFLGWAFWAAALPGYKPPALDRTS